MRPGKPKICRETSVPPKRAVFARFTEPTIFCLKAINDKILARSVSFGGNIIV